MDAMDEEVETMGFMDDEEEEFGDDSENDEFLVVPLNQEEQLVRRLSEVDRFEAKIAVELEKENPCKGVVNRELLELELGALARDRASIEGKLRLLSSTSSDSSVGVPRDGFHENPDMPTTSTNEGTSYVKSPFLRSASSSKKHITAAEQRQEQEVSHRRPCHRSRGRRPPAVSEPDHTLDNNAGSGAFSEAFILSRGAASTAQQPPFAVLDWSDAAGGRGGGGSTASLDSNNGSDESLDMAASSVINEVNIFQHMTTVGRSVEGELFERQAMEKTRRFWSRPPPTYERSSKSAANRTPDDDGKGGGDLLTPPSPACWRSPQRTDGEISARQPEGSTEISDKGAWLRRSSGNDHRQRQRQRQWTDAHCAPDIDIGGGDVGYFLGSGATTTPIAYEPVPAMSYDRRVSKRYRYHHSPFPGGGRSRMFCEGAKRAGSGEEERRRRRNGDDRQRASSSSMLSITSSSSSPDLPNAASYYDDRCHPTSPLDVSYSSPGGHGNIYSHSRHISAKVGAARRRDERDRVHDDDNNKNDSSKRRDFRSTVAPFSEPTSGTVSAPFPKGRSFRNMDQSDKGFSARWSRGRVGGPGRNRDAKYDVEKDTAGTAPAAIAMDYLEEGAGAGGGFECRGKQEREFEAAWGGRRRLAQDASLPGDGGGPVERMGQCDRETSTAPGHGVSILLN